jgi:hypothetical protein
MSERNRPIHELGVDPLHLYRRCFPWTKKTVAGERWSGAG